MVGLLPAEFQIAVTGAEHPMAVAIAFKLLSAMPASECVVRFSLHSFGMCVPPRHSAKIRAELLLPLMGCLLKRLFAIPAQTVRLSKVIFLQGVSGTVGLHSILW
jgi:hypothetical protein